MKNILVTGINSYIGTSFGKWLAKNPIEYKVSFIEVRDEAWKKMDFSKYDVILHVAGIAHISKDPKMEKLYYKVNRDLTIEIAQKAKNEGVKQFIFTSSIIVYGDSIIETGIIERNTKPLPSNFYGNSKLQAEEGIEKLITENFKVAILRLPMIYGKGSKGNYPKLAKLAKKTPIFVRFDNNRSMLHIDNLCELIKLIIDNEEKGLFFPQNKEYVNTSELVRTIADVYGKNIHMTRLFNPLIKLMLHISIIGKLFGNLGYEMSMSEYKKANYQIRLFRESIELTEN